jgi:uncharacterized protein (DUF362 family)
MLDIDDLLNRLSELAHAEGGWGYTAGSTPQVEPTCLALLALATQRERRREVIDKHLGVLTRWQEADGSFRVRDGREEAVWPTALALFVLASLDAEPLARGLAAGWLLHVRGEKLDNPDEYRRDFDIDPEIIGWPWTEGTFSWTEPTSWACLALRRAGFGSQPRVAEGLRLLLDRAFDEGGVNCGNRRVFGRPTEPVPTMSALMLLACSGLPDQPRLQAARSYLIKVADHSDDLEHLCWIRLALQPWAADALVAKALPAINERLQQVHDERREGQLFGASVVREALTILALSAATSPFNLSKNNEPAAAPTPPTQRGPRPWTDRLATRLRGLGIRALGQLRGLPAETAVHIAPAADYRIDLGAVIRKQYEAFRAHVPLAGKRVVLKPNLVEYHRDRVINTDPRFIAAVIELCKQEGAAEIIVAEGPGHWRNTEYLVTASGLGEVLRQHQVKFIDLNHDDPVKTPNLSRLTGLEFLYLSKTVATADVLISLPKLKTHHWAGVTLSLKNLFGTMPGISYGWPKNVLHWRGIENSIVDIALTRTPDLAIVDGIVAMEGDGPLNGTPVELGVVVMGADLVAVDSTCCRLMQLDPFKVGHLHLGFQRKLGLLPEGRIQQLGAAIKDHSRPFETLPRFAMLHGPERVAKIQSA